MTTPATSAASRSRAKRGDGEKLRARIIDRAEKLLVEAGSPESVSMRTIAERCEVTPPAVYLHFADKDALFHAVCARRFDELDQRLGEVRRSASDPLDELRLVGMAIVNFALEYPEAYRIVMMPARQAGTVPEVFHQVISSVESAAASGTLDDVDPHRAALVMLAGINGLASSMIAFPTADWGDRQAVIGHVMDVLIEGLLSA